MAEPISIAASIVTLAGVIRTTIHIVRHASKIPRQIEQISQELEELIVQLEFLQDLQQFANQTDYLGTKISSIMQTTLDRNILEFKCIENNLKRLSARYRGSKGRICWLLVGKDETLSQFDRLQEMRNALNLTINLMTMAISLLQHVSTKESEPRAMLDAKVPSGVASKYLSTWSAVEEGEESLQTSLWPRESKASTIAATSIMLPLLGRMAASFFSMRSTESRYELAFQLALPYSRLLVIRALLSGRGFLKFSMDNSLRMHRVVPSDSGLHKACESGDTLEIRRLLLESPAAIDDRTPENRSPLQMAIQSRNCSAVKLLLDHGADVNALFGRNQTSALAWATQHRSTEIVRLLLARDADCQHVTSYGWTPLFYLWWGTINQFDFVDQAETILQILASRSDFRYTYSGVIDTLSFAAIHMAVMRGTIAQMQFLLGLDPSLVQVKGFLDWTAVHVAVSEGRLDMLELLLPYYDQLEILRVKDARGWTLLHTSAAEGESDVTKHLLKIGANWQALSDPSLIEVPQAVMGRSCTPLEAASAKNFTRRFDFLNNVKEICGEACLSQELLDELDEDGQMRCP